MIEEYETVLSELLGKIEARPFNNTVMESITFHPHTPNGRPITEELAASENSVIVNASAIGNAIFAFDEVKKTIGLSPEKMAQATLAVLSRKSGHELSEQNTSFFIDQKTRNCYFVFPREAAQALGMQMETSPDLASGTLVKYSAHPSVKVSARAIGKEISGSIGGAVELNPHVIG